MSKVRIQEIEKTLTHHYNYSAITASSARVVSELEDEYEQLTGARPVPTDFKL